MLFMLVGSFGSVICTDKVGDDARIVVNARHDSNRQGCPGPVTQSRQKTVFGLCIARV
jgi:hypothetical protein